MGPAPGQAFFGRLLRLDAACLRVSPRIRILEPRGGSLGLPHSVASARSSLALSRVGLRRLPPFDSHAFTPPTREAGFTPASSPCLPVSPFPRFHPLGGGAWESNPPAGGLAPVQRL